MGRLVRADALLPPRLLALPSARPVATVADASGGRPCTRWVNAPRRVRIPRAEPYG